MKKIDLFKFGMSLFILTSPLLARDDALSVINSRQEESFLSFLRGGGTNVELLKGLPEFKQNDLDPITMLTGRPCILPNRNESLHSIAYAVVVGASQRRVLFQFTLSPAVQQGSGGSSLIQLVRNRSVTQYWVWMSSEDPQGKGMVIDFSSRSGRGMCD
jgi:hypothetical protein